MYLKGFTTRLSNWEYLIVNNCSTDNTLKIAGEYAEKDTRIHIHDNTEFLNQMQNWRPSDSGKLILSANIVKLCMEMIGFIRNVLKRWLRSPKKMTGSAL